MDKICCPCCEQIFTMKPEYYISEKKVVVDNRNLKEWIKKTAKSNNFLKNYKKK